MMSFAGIAQTTYTSVGGFICKSTGGAVAGGTLVNKLCHDRDDERDFLASVAGAVLGPAAFDIAVPVAGAAISGLRDGQQVGTRIAMASAFDQAAGGALTSGVLGIVSVVGAVAVSRPDVGVLTGPVVGILLAPAMHSGLRAAVGNLESFTITTASMLALVAWARVNQSRRHS